MSVLMWVEPAGGIGITMDYEETDRPAIDPNGSLLQAIVDAAAAIWEPLLVSSEHFEINFAWDFDLDGNTLAETFPQALTAPANQRWTTGR